MLIPACNLDAEQTQFAERETPPSGQARVLGNDILGVKDSVSSISEDSMQGRGGVPQLQQRLLTQTWDPPEAPRDAGIEGLPGRG